ncbi:MAG: 3-hydroxyacyl-ACP dehydratase FabZ [Myxococcales bacterium]|nr:3-hydroxyacyl-ACP dehydratase FabZ [Myxococcales bacterium]USN50523.1 MAG: 3-hydroxyacyl-ACP dehydratase FabZ [Myxococcales bacterium]
MNENKTIDFEAIKKILPHRYPFLLVDRVLSANKTSICALKNVSANEPFFNGHFPDFAVMPGVLQVEAMAQAAGLMLALNGDFDTKSQIAFLAGVDNAKFKRQVVPGDQLLIEVEIINQRKNLLKVQAKTKVEDQIASSAEIILVSKSL